MLIGLITAISAVFSVLGCFSAGGFDGSAWIWRIPAGFLGSFLSLGILAFLFLWLLCALVDMEKPQEKDSKFYRIILYLYVDAIMAILQMRVKAEGLEKMPKDGRVLLVCNHINDLDPVLLLGYFKKKQLAFISKRENDQKFLVGKMMHKIMCQPINRENDKEALKTILKCVKLIREDEVSIAVFPEGYTSMDGLLHPFRNGVFKIAMKTKVPVVVCTVRNTNQVFRNAKKMKPTNVTLRLLDVIPPERYEGMTTVELGDMVHKIMADDLGPELCLPQKEKIDLDT